MVSSTLSGIFKSFPMCRGADGWLKPTSFYLTWQSFIAPGRLDISHPHPAGAFACPPPPPLTIDITENNENNPKLINLSQKQSEGCRLRLLYGLLSLAALLAGIAIYLLFRDLNNIVLFSWIPQPELLKTVLIPLKPSVLTNFLRYHLPDTLWFVSAILFFRFLWFYKPKTQTVYIVCFFCLGLVLEISQLSGNIPGTFDWFDLLFMGIGAFVEGLLYKFFTTRRMT
jgi:hypothetical protein